MCRSCISSACGGEERKFTPQHHRHDAASTRRRISTTMRRYATCLQPAHPAPTPPIDAPGEPPAIKMPMTRSIRCRLPAPLAYQQLQRKNHLLGLEPSRCGPPLNGPIAMHVFLVRRPRSLSRRRGGRLAGRGVTKQAPECFATTSKGGAFSIIAHFFVDLGKLSCHPGQLTLPSAACRSSASLSRPPLLHAASPWTLATLQLAAAGDSRVSLSPVQIPLLPPGNLSASSMFVSNQKQPIARHGSSSSSRFASSYIAFFFRHPAAMRSSHQQACQSHISPSNCSINRLSRFTSVHHTALCPSGVSHSCVSLQG
ncbi:uncharacterized protein BKA78DRAFT_53280 [Phyllosticta capitalensis]|uniref:uncharacterized protein n=1 Tax=Phyllosticta capitalensis TaxID=121624 RepID=UPI0031300E92